MAEKIEKVVGYRNSREKQVELIARIQVGLGLLVAVYFGVTIGIESLQGALTVVILLAQTAILYVLLRTMAETLAAAKKAAGISTTTMLIHGAPIFGHSCSKCDCVVEQTCSECPNCRSDFTDADPRWRPDSVPPS